MTRSYRHTPIARDYRKPGVAKKYKRIANKTVRKYNDLINGNMYKKVFCSYDIHDYTCWMRDLPKNWKLERWCRQVLVK